ncbi:MAG TPA: lysylphosphatidylglycerol synthase domain-containing protein, partial [Acidobacteriaceae bacterium]|nr:lysylphosphatidylglycerol synthase domain-containing protein [Acidobacteriaceae bacterium]
MQRPRQLWAGILLVMLAVLVFLFHGRIHFDVRGFLIEIRHVSVAHVAAAVALIYLCMGLRAMRWAVFIRPQKHIHTKDLLGPQFIGFAAVGLFGRLADLTRPYLVAKRTRLSVSSQIAVYTV